MSEAAMVPFVARFKDLLPQKAEYEKTGIPPEVFEFLSGRTLYVVMAPENGKGATAGQSISGAPGLAVGILECPPGDGAPLHAHMETGENFMPLTGQWELTWGDCGEHSTVLEPFDMISVPVGAARRFTNVSQSDALLLTLIQGGEALSDIYYPPETGEEVTARFGAEVKSKLEKIGYSFAMGV
jgi:uncharacterized RmlC-like cupin family protein